MKPALLLCGLLLSALSWADPLSFDTFIHLHRDMSEADLRRLAGKPDYERKAGGDASQPAAGDRQLFWVGDADLPYTTVITLHDGVVSDIRRDKRL